MVSDSKKHLYLRWKRMNQPIMMVSLETKNVENLLEMLIVSKLMGEEKNNTTLVATPKATHSFTHLNSLIKSKNNTLASTLQIEEES
jgi:hypothetical protein